MRGELLHRSVSRKDEAFPWLERVIELRDSALPTEIRASRFKLLQLLLSKPARQQEASFHAHELVAEGTNPAAIGDQMMNPKVVGNRLRHEEANVWFTAGIEADPSNVKARISRGVANFARVQASATARKLPRGQEDDLLVAQALDPSRFHTGFSAAALATLAKALRHAQKAVREAEVEAEMYDEL